MLPFKTIDGKVLVTAAAPARPVHMNYLEVRAANVRKRKRKRKKTCSNFPAGGQRVFSRPLTRLAWPWGRRAFQTVEVHRGRTKRKQEALWREIGAYMFVRYVKERARDADDRDHGGRYPPIRSPRFLIEEICESH